MTNTKSTKRALLTSVMALFLCFAMLLGTTYAWFTDSVTSANNIIKSGNLDIELEYWNGTKWTDVKDQSDILSGNLWEPGYTDVAYFRINNAGSLALKYQFGVNIVSEKTGTNVYGETFTLSDYIYFDMIDIEVDENETPSVYADSKAVLKAVKSSESKKISEGYINDGTLEAGNTVYLAMAVYMPYAVGNAANHDGEDIPQIDLGINIFATQAASETDGTGDNKYDEEAAYLDAALVHGGTFYMTEDIVRDYVEVSSGVTVTINGNETHNTIKAGSASNYAAISTDGSNMVLNDVNVKSAGGGVGAADGAKVVFNSGSVYVDTTSTSGRYCFYAEGEGTTITINGGSFSWDPNDNQKRAYIYAGAGTTVYVNGGTFGKASTREGYTAGILGTGNVVITGGTFGFNPSAWVPAGYEAVKSNDIWTVSAKAVTNAADLADILTKNKNIEVVLANDIDLPISSLGTITVGSGEYKLGGENTETITINLNGHKLNVITTYKSTLGAKNDDAVITIKNGSMTSSLDSGTWNNYDLSFANCNYVIENVTFDKAIAFVNAEKSAQLMNVTINETNDYYALWISAAGQNVTIDGLTVNSAGRGIKIDEQYVTAEKVTLNVSNATFNTAKKAAIVVKSVEGADITLSNVDISGVTQDTVHAVWVDEDSKSYADLVAITGGTAIVEPTVVTAADQTALDDALNNANGAAVNVILGSGSYIIPDSAHGKTLTIIGNGETLIATQDDGSYEGCDYSLDGATVTFENITINTDSSTYTGYARCKGTYNNCTINGTYTLYGDSVFNNCTFNVSGDVYNIWTWGALNATFNDCTFNSDGKALLLYGQANTNLTVNNCTFNDKGGLTDLKAAIEIGNDYNKSYTLTVNNTTVNGYEINDKGISTGTTLWANKNSMGTDKLNVIVDGVDVY